MQLTKKTVIKRGYKIIRITHHQVLRQSLNYQSMEAQAGIEMEINSDATEQDVKAAYQKAAEIVEAQLASKAVEQKRVLTHLARS